MTHTQIGVALLLLAITIGGGAGFWAWHLVGRLDREVRTLRCQIAGVRGGLDALGGDHQALVNTLATTATPTRVEFLNLQDAVDNLEQSEQAHRNLEIVRAAQMSNLQTELARMRQNPYFWYRGGEN